MELWGGGVLILRDAWLDREEASSQFSALIEETPWASRKIRIAGRELDQPRLTAWYGDESAQYTYSGLTLVPLPWTARLADLRSRIERTSEARFNGVLVNLYRDERDSMGLHADKEPELGRNPTIASLSLGARRRFVLKRDREKIELEMLAGSLLVMSGTTQHMWKHGVPKERTPCAPRINLTFRLIR
jgi:alkylated DNA repair dioxygenase AlkB